MFLRALIYSLFFLLFVTGASASPGKEYSIHIYITGQWAGHFQPLPALHSFLERIRQRARASHGGVVLLYAGDLTETSIQNFRSKAFPSGLNLARYMKFDALALGRRENEFLLRSGAVFARKRFPAISFNLRHDQDSPIKPYRIVRRGDYNLFVGGLTAGSEPHYENDVFERLFFEFERQKGLDFKVLLTAGVNQPHEEPAPEKSESEEQEHSAYFVSPWDKKQEKNVAADVILADDSYFFEESRAKEAIPESIGQIAEKTLLNESVDFVEGAPDFIARISQWAAQKNTSPYMLAADEKNLTHLLIGETGAAVNRFYRLPEGSYVCRVRAQAVCEVVVVFRARRIIAVNQRFFSVNGEGFPGSYVPPDVQLQRLLK